MVGQYIFLVDIDEQSKKQRDEDVRNSMGKNHKNIRSRINHEWKAIQSLFFSKLTSNEDPNSFKMSSLRS